MTYAENDALAFLQEHRDYDRTNNETTNRNVTSVIDCKTGSNVGTGQAYRINACHRHCEISCAICALMAHGG